MLWWKIYKLINLFVIEIVTWKEHCVLSTFCWLGSWESQQIYSFCSSTAKFCNLQLLLRKALSTVFISTFKALLILFLQQIHFCAVTSANQSLKWLHLFATESEFIHSLSGHMFTVPSLNMSATRFNLVFSKASDQP